MRQHHRNDGVVYEGMGFNHFYIDSKGDAEVDNNDLLSTLTNTLNRLFGLFM